MEPITVALFGISGSGKGTQASLLADHLHAKDPAHGIVRPDMGSLLRAFIQGTSPTAQRINDIVSHGGLTPSFMPIHLLTQDMVDNFDGAQHLILDGVCRRPDQSRAVDDFMRLFERTNLHAIVFQLSEGSARERLMGRGRSDDEAKAIDSRFAWYREQVVPAAEELKRLGWTMHEVDAEPDIATIHKNVLSVLGLAAL